MSGVFFNGRKYITPVTASAINDDAMQNRNLTVGNAYAALGKATGGKPKTLLSFSSPEHARSILRSGELLDAIIKAFDPSAETPAPGVVYGIRVNPAEQSQLVLVDDDDAPVITLKSVNYGQKDNQIKVKIEEGTDIGFRVTVQIDSDYYTGDDIARAAFSVEYTGSESTANLTVNATNAVLKAGSSTVATIPLADFPTVGELVDRINVVPDFSAAVLEDSYNSPTVDGLDFVTDGDCKTAALTVRADLQALVDWLNSGAQPLVTATRAASVGTLPVYIPFTYLAGGSEGTTANGDWQDGLTVAQTIREQVWISPITSTAAIHAMVSSHVSFCTNVLRRERRAICGMAAGSTDVDAIAAAKALNNDRVSLAHIGYYDYDLNGKLKLFPAYFTASLAAAMFGGVNPGEPLTNKTIKVQGLERELMNPTDTDPLIEAGVFCVENTEEGYKIVKSISTWLGNDKYNRVEQSTGAALDFTVRNVRQAVDVLRGKKGDPLLLSRSVSITESVLRELARPEPQGPGVLAGDANSPAYRNIRATFEGDVTRIEFECSPVIPNNYILVTVYAVPYSGSAAAA